MLKLIVAASFAALLMSVGCTSIPSGMSPVNGFEAQDYMGRWYEIARLDHPFERGLENVTADYALVSDGEIRVINRGFDPDTQSWKEIEGRARFLKDASTGSLKVSFFGPFYAGYHIIALDLDAYSYAMVTGPNRSYLWILSRSPSMSDSLYASLVAQADQWGFDTAQLIKVRHAPPAG